jgi:hypothetical protein
MHACVREAVRTCQRVFRGRPAGAAASESPCLHIDEWKRKLRDVKIRLVTEGFVDAANRFR